MHKNIEYIMVLVRRVPNKKLSWYLRCIKRLETIVELDKNTWYLRPLPKLGDRRQYYIVRYDEKTESLLVRATISQQSVDLLENLKCVLTLVL